VLSPGLKTLGKRKIPLNRIFDGVFTAVDDGYSVDDALDLAGDDGRQLPEPDEGDEAKFVDLMAALRESVERTQSQRKKAPAKRPRKPASRKAS
jgi:hypothetical protein